MGFYDWFKPEKPNDFFLKWGFRSQPCLKWIHSNIKHGQMLPTSAVTPERTQAIKESGVCCARPRLHVDVMVYGT